MSSTSAVIPVYNGEAYLAEAIESVLRQDHPLMECLVVDDGSTDGSAAVAARFGAPVRVLRQPNRGVSAARNAGTDAARGDLIAFLDADDRWLPEKTRLQVAAFASDPELAFVYAGLRIVRGDEVVAEVWPPAAEDALRNSLLLEAPTISIPSTGMFRRDLLVAAGGFREDLSTSADTELACRLAARHRIAAIDEPLVLYRLHPGQMHRDLERFEREMTKVVDEMFADPAVVGRLGDRRRRALANLHASIAGQHFVDRHPLETARYALRASLLDPGRTAELLRRRIRRSPRPT